MSHSPRMSSVLTIALVLAATLPSVAAAQTWRERVTQKAKEKVAEKVEERPAAEKTEASEAAAPGAAKAPAGGATADSTQRPGEGAWANYDFVPGERVLFAEDFTSDRVGNFPRRLELLDGNMEVVEWQGRRWMRANSAGAVRVPLPETLPERFTIEFDLTLPWMGMLVHGDADKHGMCAGCVPTAVVKLSGTEAGLFRGSDDGKSAVHPSRFIPTLEADFEKGFLSRPLRVRVQADGPYVKVYLNEARIANMPNADFGRQKFLTFEFHENANGDELYPTLITNISINAGGMDLYDALSADGRVATQGILFDTGSDRLRPESTPTLQEITAMLQQHADLSLTIEGHTDNVGAAAANQALSEKRAAAVKAYLVEQGIDASRLSTAGFGDTKPKAPNATPEGRSTNRRVELVKGN